MATAIGRGVLMPVARRRVGIFGTVIAFLLFYMIAFPKGGIKVSGIPLTIGYTFTPLLALLAMARARGLAIPIDRLLALMPCLALALWSAIVVHMNGAESLGSVISYFFTVLYLPMFGLIAFSPLILDDHRHLIERTLVWAMRFIVVYGLFLFVFRQVTGHWIEIPYVTVNVADVGQLDDKYIRRGLFFKLISTYNNGNIFGLCVLIMAPLYCLLEERRILRGALYLALFLTLSRTAWIGMALLFTVRSLSRGVRPATILYLLVSSAVALLILSFTVTAMGRDMSFLWDRNLGGRIAQLDILSDIRIIPDQIFTSLPEIAYLGMIKFFGIPGLIFFVAYLAGPPIILCLEGVRPMSPAPAAACMQGLVIYMIMACADAAFGLIPVMMVFWMIAGMGFWYAHGQAKLERRAYAPAG
jgi:hypothetical protein